MSHQVSLLGLGTMGSALASAFLRAGYETTVWNRSPDKAKALVDSGAHVSSSPAECFAASNLVIICLLDDRSVRETLQRVPSVPLEGKVIVNFTNSTPGGAQKTRDLIQSLAGASKVGYVQGSIMAVPPMIGLPSSVLLFSSDEQAFHSAKSHLAILGTTKFLDANVRTAPLTDLAMLSGMNGLFSGFLHATAMVRAGGNSKKTSATEFVTLLVPWLHAMTDLLPLIAGQIDANDFSSGGSNLGMQRVSLDNIIESSEALGVEADVLQPLRKWMVKRIEAGGEGDGLAALVGVLGRERQDE